MAATRQTARKNTGESGGNQRQIARKNTGESSENHLALDEYLNYKFEEGDDIGTYVIKMHEEWSKVRDIVGAPDEYVAARRVIDSLPPRWMVKAQQILSELLEYDKIADQLKIDYGEFTDILSTMWIDYNMTNEVNGGE